jgi:hypothetical protein
MECIKKEEEKKFNSDEETEIMLFRGVTGPRKADEGSCLLNRSCHSFDHQ